MLTSSFNSKYIPFRVCSGCGHVFITALDFEKNTICAGLICTGDYADFNLKLRNCKFCGSTLSTKVDKN